MSTEVEQNLDQYAWDAPEGDFFGQKAKIDGNREIDAVIEQVKKETPKKEDTTVVKKEKEAKFFTDDNANEDDDVDITEDPVFGKKKVDPKDTEEETIEGTKDKEDTATELGEEETTEINVYSAFAKDLKDKGVFANVEIPEGELDEDKLYELQEGEIQARVDETITSLFEEVSEKGKDFINYIKDGGDPDEFLRLYTQTVVPQYIKDNEDSKDAVIKYYLKNIEKQDDEDIKETLEILEEGAKKDKMAQRYSDIIKSKAEETRKQIIEDQKKEQAEVVKEQKKYFDLVESKLKEVTEVKGIEITDTDKKKLYNYMLKPTVKVGINQYQTPMATKIQDILTNPKSLDKAILLAKLLESDFDTANIIKTKVSKEVKKVKSNLQVAMSGGKKITGGASISAKSLMDID